MVRAVRVLVVVDDLDIVGVTAPPDEAEPPLVVDADRVLPGPVPFYRPFGESDSGLREAPEAARCVSLVARCYGIWLLARLANRLQPISLFFGPVLQHSIS